MHNSALFLFDEHPVPSFILHRKTLQFLAMNKAGQKEYGYPEEEILQMNLFQILPPHEAERLKKSLYSGLYSPPEREEWQHVRINGVIFDMEVKSKVIRYEDEEAVLTSVSPIEKKKEVVLTVEEARWKYALDSSGDGMWDWNIQTGEVFFSDQWKAILGYSPDEIQNSIKEWEERIHPDDRAYTLTQLNNYLRNHTGEYKSEHRVRCKDGSYKWILDRGKIFSYDDNHQPLRMIGTHSDINSQKLAQNTIRKEEQFLSELLRLVNDTLGCNSIEQVLHLVAERGAAMFQADNAYVTLWNEQNRRAIMISANGDPVHFTATEDREKENNLTEVVLREKKVMVVDDPYNSPYISPEIASRFPDRCLMGIPVIHAQKDIGAVLIGCNMPRTVSPAEISQASLASKILSLIIARIQYVGQLEKQEQMFRSFVEDAPIGIMAVNREGRYVMANQSSADLLGYSVEELLKMDILQVLHPSSKNEGMFHFNQLLNNQPASTQMVLQRKDGTTFWSTLHGVKLDDDLMLGFHIDINETIESKEALAREKGLLSGLLNSIPDLIFYKDLDGRYIGGNPGFAKFSGLSPDDFQGKTDFELFDAGRATKYASKDKEILQTRQPSFTEDIVSYPDGTPAVLETLKAPFYDSEGKMIGLIGVSRNISEKKKIEEKLRESDELLKQLTANVPGAIYQYQYFPDGKSAFPYASSGIESVYEVTPEEVRLDASLVFTRIHPDDQQRVTESIKESYRYRTVWECDYRVILPVRGLRWLHGLAAPTRQNDNSVIWHGHIQDITEKRNLEEKLSENEKFLKELFDSMEEVAWVMRYPEPELLNISQAVENLYGYPAGDFYEDTELFVKTVHPEDVQVLLSALGQIEDTGRAEVQYRLVRPDGEIRWVIDKFWLHYDENNQPVRMEGILIDITRIKLLENDILFRSSLQQILMDMASNFINLPAEKIGEAINRTLKKVGRFVGADRAYIFDYDFGNNTCSNTYEWCAEGISPEIGNLQDVPLDAIPHWVNTHRQRKSMLIPDVSALSEADAVRQILEPQGVKSLITIPMYTGDELTGFIGFDSVMHHKDYSQNEQQLLMFLSEIFVNAQTRLGSERTLVNSERKFRQLAENVNDLFWLREAASGQVIYTNPAYGSFLGKDRLSDKLRCFIESTLPEDRDLLQTALSDLTSNEPAEMELRLLSHKNEVHWFRLKIQPVTGLDGVVVRQVGLATDITRMKNAEKTLKEALEMERKLGEMKSRFVSMASHEFRTPLASVIMAAETIENYRHKMDDDEIHRYVDRIKRNVEFLRDMISRVLNLSRIESGRMPLSPERTEMVAYLANWMGDYRIKHDLKHFLEFDFPKEEIFLDIDRQLFSQVIDNLVINARKYAHEHTTIRLAVSRNNRLVVISVADEGMGIPDKDQEFLFDPFFRASNANSINGTGLGLPFVKQIVERHGGTIRVSSRENVGTTFFVELPDENYSELGD